MGTAKKILLVDLDDERRDSRVGLLTQAGYSVEVRKDRIAAERLDHESTFDLVGAYVEAAYKKAHPNG